MKFTRVESGLYVSETNMMIKNVSENISRRWAIYDQNRRLLVFMCSLKEAKEWIEELEAETHCGNNTIIQNDASESEEAPEKEITSEEAQKPTESECEPQSDIEAQAREEAFQRELVKIKKKNEKLISRELIEAYNRLANALKGREYHFILNMYHEFKDVDGRFKEIGHGLPRDHMIELEGEEFFIKKIRGEFWLYWEFRGDCERWLLNDLSKAYFNVKEV